MGSSFSKQMCCVVCERCRKQEAEEANGESSETKPILQTSEDPLTFLDTQPPTPALKVPKHGSKDLQPLSQDRQPSADALEENGETCSAADPMEWEATWNPMDFFVAPADEVEVEGKDLTQADNQQEKVGNPEEQIKPVPGVPEAQPAGDTALGAEVVAEEEQPQGPGEPGSEGALCAGITLQEKNILNLLEVSSESEPGQGCELEPPADTRGVLTGRDGSLCAVQVAGDTEPCLCAEGTGRAKGAERTPQSALRAELTRLVEAVSVLTLQNPSEVTARDVAELYSTSAVFWEPLRLEWGSPEPPNQRPDALKPETQCSLSPAQGMESLCCAEPVGPSQPLHQPGEGALCEPGGEGSRECEAEPQHRITQQTVELPGEPAAPVPTPVKQEAELLNVPLLLSEVLGGGGEIEAENVEA